MLNLYDIYNLRGTCKYLRGKLEHQCTHLVPGWHNEKHHNELARINAGFPGKCVYTINTRSPNSVLICTNDNHIVVVGHVRAHAPLVITPQLDICPLYLGLRAVSPECVQACGRSGIVVMTTASCRIYNEGYESRVYTNVEPYTRAKRLRAHRCSEWVYAACSNGIYRFTADEPSMKLFMNTHTVYQIAVTPTVVAFSPSTHWLYVTPHDCDPFSAQAIPLPGNVLFMESLRCGDIVVVVKGWASMSVFAYVYRTQVRTFDSRGCMYMGTCDPGDPCISRYTVVGDVLVTNSRVLCTHTMRTYEDTKLSTCKSGVCNEGRCAILYENNNICFYW